MFVSFDGRNICCSALSSKLGTNLCFEVRTARSSTVIQKSRYAPFKRIFGGEHAPAGGSSRVVQWALGFCIGAFMRVLWLAEFAPFVSFCASSIDNRISLPTHLAIDPFRDLLDRNKHCPLFVQVARSALLENGRICTLSVKSIGFRWTSISPSVPIRTIRTSPKRLIAVRPKGICDGREKCYRN
jgi:hypothetical protein